MNLKEVSELRRRFRMDRNAISRIYGCFVNSSREIVSYIDESMGILPQDEAEKYLNLLKKALSGKLRSVLSAIAGHWICRWADLQPALSMFIRSRDVACHF